MSKVKEDKVHGACVETHGMSPHVMILQIIHFPILSAYVRSREWNVTTSRGTSGAFNKIIKVQLWEPSVNVPMQMETRMHPPQHLNQT